MQVSASFITFMDYVCHKKIKQCKHVTNTSQSFHAHGVWHWAHVPPSLPLSANVSSVKPDRGDNHHSSAISTKSLAGSECEEMLCCQLDGSGFSPDEWRKGSVTPVNDPNGPWFPVQGLLNGLHYVSLKNQNGLCSRFPALSLYHDSSSAETQECP